MSSSSGSGAGLSADKATSYIANFAMVDENSDGKISQSEFKSGCEKGSVQTAAGCDVLNLPAQPESMKQKESGNAQNQ